MSDQPFLVSGLFSGPSHTDAIWWLLLWLYTKCLVGTLYVRTNHQDVYPARAWLCRVIFSVQTFNASVVVRLQYSRSLTKRTYSDGSTWILFWPFFSNVVLCVESIISFSVRHRLHPLDRLGYAEALLNVRQLMLKALPSRLSLQTCIDNSVLFAYLSFLKLVWWFASHCLKGVSVEPMYFFSTGLLSVSALTS